jgi:hypothetical protein
MLQIIAGQAIQTVLLLAKGSTTFFGWKIVPRSLTLLPK